MDPEENHITWYLGKVHANLFIYNRDLGMIILLRTSKYQSKSEVLILNQQCMT